MENLDEREVHPVVHPEDGNRRQVWSVHAVDGEEHNNEAKDGPAQEERHNGGHLDGSGQELLPSQPGPGHDAAVQNPPHLP